MIIHLEPDILECEVKWALRSITTNKAREVMKFQLSYFKSWKMMLWKLCNQYASKFGKRSSGHRTEKGQFSIPKKGNAKECSNYHTIVLISQTSNIMLKIPQARLQPYISCELPDVPAGFRGRGTRDKLPTSVGSLKNQESSRKTSTSALLTMPKPLTVWITTNCGKFFTR